MLITLCQNCTDPLEPIEATGAVPHPACAACGTTLRELLFAYNHVVLTQALDRLRGRLAPIERAVRAGDQS